jgi:hypothetical protein
MIFIAQCDNWSKKPIYSKTLKVSLQYVYFKIFFFWRNLQANTETVYENNPINTSFGNGHDYGPITTAKTPALPNIDSCLITVYKMYN